MKQWKSLSLVVKKSDHKKIDQDSEAITKTENVEVKNEVLNDLEATEQTITSVDELSDVDVTDADKNISNKEV